ncbi:hypothetical protein PR003_g15562 [Phytophthora rubi]|uniref:Uncharacterized protein n=1 Tax=Phytophthora rubi TaxID=129364 RepID=A0A6A4EYS3_9STRA|nr:hypothetical protein PR003_g15562 [Phytophthora rubi]
MNDASTPELQHRTDSSGHRLVLHPSGGYVSVPVDFVPTPVSSPQNERLCKYSGTRCANVRSLKRNGELHNLCEFHRERANANQAASTLGRGSNVNLVRRRLRPRTSPNRSRSRSTPQTRRWMNGRRTCYWRPCRTAELQ